MTTDTFDILGECQTILERAKAAIQAQMEYQGVNATGNTSKSFRVVTEGSHVMLLMGGERTAPLETLEIGRPGGNVPGGFVLTKAGVVDVSNTFKAILIQWAKDKGIPDFGWGRATMLGRRIAKEGTLRHSKPVEVYSEAVIRAANEVLRYAKAQVTDLIHKELSNVIIDYHYNGRK